jgi:hypothetical protein
LVNKYLMKWGFLVVFQGRQALFRPPRKSAIRIAFLAPIVPLQVLLFAPGRRPAKEARASARKAGDLSDTLRIGATRGLT